MDSPHRQACGLRPGSTASLVALSFAFYPGSAHDDPRVPAGFDFYNLQAKLSELQVVFLYRFLMENVQYISTMLAMRLPPMESSAHDIIDGDEGSRKEIDAAPSPGPPLQTTPTQHTQPFVMVMDVEMNAPVISLPRASDSTDAISVDLGTLHLRSHVERPSNTHDNSHTDVSESEMASSLVEVADLTFSGVTCCIIQAGQRGAAVVKNPEQGWQIGWRRPLAPEFRGADPYVSALICMSMHGMCAHLMIYLFLMRCGHIWFDRCLFTCYSIRSLQFDVALHVPFIKASLSDWEYLSMTTVASSNFAEMPKIPPGAAWVEEQHVVAGSEEGEDAAAALVAPPWEQSPGADLLRTLSPKMLGYTDVDSAFAVSSPTSPDGKNLPSTSPSPQLSSKTKIRTLVSLGLVELELKQTVEGLPRPVPLARFLIENLYVAYRNEESGAMHVQCCVPRVEVEDLRPEVPVEQSLVISSGHKASLLMLQVKTCILGFGVCLYGDQE